jgi:hypothetical protein
MNDNPQAQQVDANRVFEIKLPIGIWSQILIAVGKLPWEQADPIIREINRQIGLELNPTSAIPAVQ